MNSKVMRVVGIVLIIVAILTGVIYVVFRLNTKVSIKGNDNEYTPIDQITGIYTDAKLKPGCIVTSGDAFSGQDGIHLFYSLGPIVSKIKGESSEQAGHDVRNIKIIDVYGDKCTIIFICDDDPGYDRFICDDYPLANLEYDPLEVFLANDGIKTDLYGTGYTTQGAPSFCFPRVVLLFIPISVVTGVILLVLSRRKNKAIRSTEQNSDSNS